MEIAFTGMNGTYYYLELFEMLWESIEIDNMVSLLREIKN